MRSARRLQGGRDNGLIRASISAAKFLPRVMQSSILMPRCRTCFGAVLVTMELGVSLSGRRAPAECRCSAMTCESRCEGQVRQYVLTYYVADDRSLTTHIDDRASKRGFISSSVAFCWQRGPCFGIQAARHAGAMRAPKTHVLP